MSRYVVTFRGTAAGERITNVVGYVDDNVPGPLDGVTVDSISSAWTSNIVPRLASIYTYEGATAVNLDNPTIGFESVAGAGATGLSAGSVLPTFVAVRVNWSTGLRGRAFRGRTGLGPIVESETTVANALDPAARDAWQTRINAFLTAIQGISGGTSNADLAVISRVVNKVLRPSPVTTRILAGEVDARLGSRVSRKP